MSNILFVDDYLKKDFGKILKRAGLNARRWMKESGSDTARVYDRNIESLALTVDLYGEWTRVVDYSDEERRETEVNEIEDVISRFLYVEKKKIVFVRRKKREKGEQHEKSGEECRVTVKENGLVFECELLKYADTGLFLDQEETRRAVREMALNQRVLNLFSYTGSFSVYAASGGAESVVSVDLSNVYSGWAGRNLEANGFLDEGKYERVTDDARHFLEKSIEEKRKFDLVIFDPPAFSNSHKAETFDVQRDYAEYLNMIHSLLSDGGVVIFSENLGGFRFDARSLSGLYETHEITGDVYAPNFSHRRKSCRVWILRKNGKKRHERKEGKMKEELERFSVGNLDDTKGEVKKRERKGAKAISFDRDDFPREEKNVSSEEGGRNRERKGGFSSGGHTYSRERRKRADEFGEHAGKRFGERDDRYSGRRDDRYSERRDDRYSERRDDRYSARRDDRYSERRDDRYSARRDDRYSDRRDDRYSGRRDDRYSARPSYRRNYEESGERHYSDRRDDYQEKREYSKKNGYSSFARRESDGSRSTYRRNSYSPSRRQDEGSFASGRPAERRKKSSPKPFGYDSFMANRRREGVTGEWLGQQEYVEKDDK